MLVFYDLIHLTWEYNYGVSLIANLLCDFSVRYSDSNAYSLIIPFLLYLDVNVLLG